MFFQHDTILKGQQKISESLGAPSVLLNKYFGILHKKNKMGWACGPYWAVDRWIYRLGGRI